MPGFSLQNFVRAVRGVILLAVFAGMLFSCGEGIRLFPFPLSEITRNSPFRLNSDEERGYEKNIHRFEDSQLNSQSKSQRESRQTHWANVYNALENLSFSDSSKCCEINTSFDTQTFRSRFALASISSRAPPVS